MIAPNRVNILSVPSTSIEDVCVFLEDKAVLVALSVTEYHVLVLVHHTLGGPGHQVQPPVIIGLHKVVHICKSVQNDHSTQ